MPRPKQENTSLSSRLDSLSLSPSTRTPPTSFPKHSKPAPTARVADSWEDSDSDSSDTETESIARPSSPLRQKGPPSAPPPTPISRPTTSSTSTRSIPSSFSSSSEPLHDLPSYAINFDAFNSNNAFNSNKSNRGGDDRRPEKSNAAAARMIAGALGVRAPKRSEEERRYERVVRENEKRRKEGEAEERRRAEMERERALRAVWED